MTGRQPGGADPLARYVFAALILACFAAFFITQRLKHTPTAVQKFELAGRFSPHRAPGHNQEPISFKLDRAERITVTIVNSDEDTVATLLVDQPVVRYKQFSLRWNGRRGTAHGYQLTLSPHGRAILVPDTRGPFAPAGEYTVEVDLLEQGHSVPSPHTFTLEAR